LGREINPGALSRNIADWSLPGLAALLTGSSPQFLVIATPPQGF